MTLAANINNALFIGEGLNQLFSTQIDTVAVFDSNFNQVFANARPLKCTVRQSSKPMEHPLETGQIISDYKITLPVEIILPLIVPAQYYRDIYAQIYSLFSTSQLLTVQTRSSNFVNMVVMDMPDEERPDMFDVITIELHMKQVLIVQAISNFAPADPVQTNTQNSGQQSGTPAPLPTNSVTNNQQAVQATFEAGGAW